MSETYKDPFRVPRKKCPFCRDKGMAYEEGWQYEEHVKCCEYNPVNKKCYSCKHEEDPGVTIQRGKMHYEQCHINPNRAKAIPRVKLTCQHWEPKERQ